MTIPLDDITHKKLILVKQLFQRAVLQAEVKHSYVDRIMALIGFDLTNETILKAVVGAVNPAVQPKNDFQAIVQQVDAELTTIGLPVIPDKARIQHVRTIRNDAQHKAKYPNETDVSDCRTYTQDFLRQIFLNVWSKDFDSISLADAVQNTKIKSYFLEAEKYLEAGDALNATIKAKAALLWAFDLIEVSIVGHMPDGDYLPYIDDDVEFDSSKGNIKDAFLRLRNLMLLKAIGLELGDYIKYNQITEDLGIHFYEDGEYSSNFAGDSLKLQDAEYVVTFVINAILQIESLVGNIEKPFNL